MPCSRGDANHRRPARKRWSIYPGPASPSAYPAIVPRGPGHTGSIRMTTVLFVVFPYVAVFLAIFGGIYRYFSNRFSYSALSSQMLESRQLFWGSVSWHYGIVLILLAHLLAFLFPGVTAAILGTSYRLVIIEIIGLSLGLY